jgi:hypothetical protein
MKINWLFVCGAACLIMALLMLVWHDPWRPPPQAPAMPLTTSCGVGCTISGGAQSNSGTAALCTINSSNVTECTNHNAGAVTTTGGALSLTAGNNTAVYCVDTDEALKAKDKELANLRRQIKDLQRRSVN